MSRSFPLADVLSITTGRLLSRDHMDGIYRILNYLTGDNLFTHQLPRAMDACRPVVLAQHPDLAEIEVPEFDGDHDKIRAWLDETEATHGATRDLAALADWHHIDAIEEAADLVGADRVWVVPAPSTETPE